MTSHPAALAGRMPRGVRAVRLALVLGVAILVLALPPAVAAHGLSPVYQSPLPLAVYLVGAAATVALSFAFVLAYDMRAGPIPLGTLVGVPGPVRVVLRAIGILGWTWIMAQGIAGGSSTGEVASLFLWVFGWVVVAALSALVGPVWQWLDPFATLHDAGAWLLARAGIRGWEPTEVPPGLRVWPAVAGLAVVIWLELVAEAGPATLTLFLAGYTVLTLAMMAQFGRDGWRAHGETFSVWFGLLGRLAPYAAVPASATAPAPSPRDEAFLDPDAVDPHVVRRRPFASGLLAAPWRTPHIVLVAIGTGSIIYDGLSQTAPWVGAFGAPPIGTETVLLGAFLGIVVVAALGVARSVSPGAIGAGLLPISVGYLIGHYLTYVAIDSQRLLVAVSDPLQRGDNLLGTAYYEPTAAWLPPGLVWTVQLAAVVGGHMLGAWAGHVTASRDLDPPAADDARAAGREPRDLRHRKIHVTPVAHRAGRPRNLRLREVPLAVVMVALTTLTLWSLGQAIVAEEGAQTAATPSVAARSADDRL